MVSNERLKELRALGVKAVTFGPDGDPVSVEFFQRDLLDVGSIFPADADNAPTDRPPPGDESEVPRVRVPPALAAILKNGSVS